MRKGLRIFSYTATLLFSLMLTGVDGSVHAEELTVTVENGASVAITPSVEGAFVSTEYEGNTSARFTVTTDNYTGYNLSFTTGNAGEFADKLINSVTKAGNTTTYALNSIGFAIDENVFNTSAYNNMWGIKPSKYNSIENAKYLPVVSGMILDNFKKSGTNEYTIAVGVRANYENPAGEYKNTLVLTAVANPMVYEVPVKFADKTGVKEVIFAPVDEPEAKIAVDANDKTVLLSYGINYEMTINFEDGYELDNITATSGDLDEKASTYRIEITNESPALTVTGKASVLASDDDKTVAE